MTITSTPAPAPDALQRRADDKRPFHPLDWRDAEPGLARMSDVMIDTETLGTRPGAAILSIGAVMFAPDGLGESFYAPIDLSSCAAAGLAIDPATVLWWMQQSDEARAAAFPADAAPLQQVLLAFQAWFVAQEARYPWCHGATFDVPLLDAAFKACGLTAPWEFWNVRDTRTLYDVAGVKVDRKSGTHHHALDDAINQADAAARALRILGANKALSEARP
ncbi:3'-5' exonuclease [Massilia timonae]|uniref:3'-5' exonuclease n=1 Tax=Massilia timonae TaxID=47229 RepID=UPI0028D6B13A|nr:3'-5' exonuclease [Massilia timonae]